MPAVHPPWWNVNSVFGGFSLFAGYWRLILLNDDDLRLANAVHTQNPKPMETVWKRMSSARPVSPESPRAADRVSCTESSVGKCHGDTDGEDETKGDTASTPRESHTTFLVQIDREGKNRGDGYKQSRNNSSLKEQS